MTKESMWFWVGQLRELGIEIDLFNEIFSTIIYGLKLYFLTISTVNLFFGIKLLQAGNPIWIACMSLGMYNLLLFVILYDKAFAIPQNIQDLKDQILLRTMQAQQLREDLDSRQCIKKSLSSIRNRSIRVARFGTLERVSTPIFVDFVTNQVISLLVSFP